MRQYCLLHLCVGNREFAVRLIKQVLLEYRQGKSDKVYEVDLCDVGPDQCVVNFRYGRRGSTLRDGTKTTAPVTQTEAERIFDELVSSKTNKGYRDASQNPGQVSDEPIPSDDAIENEVIDAQRQAVLNRLAAGHNSSSSWRLSRAVWRAGELQLCLAESACRPSHWTNSAVSVTSLRKPA